MKKNILIMLLISSLISLNGYGQKPSYRNTNITFYTEGTKFALRKGTECFGEITISSYFLGSDKQPIKAKIKIGEPYTLPKDTYQHIVDGEFKTINISKNNITTLSLMADSETILEEFICDENNIFGDLTLMNFKKLKKVSCKKNKITSIDTRLSENLEELSCNNNLIEELTFDKKVNLKKLECSNNNLKNVNLSGIKNLERVDIGYNDLESINLKGSTHLEQLLLSDNKLINLDLTGFINLNTLNVNNNNLIELNAEGLVSLKFLYAHNNNLTSLSVAGSNKIIFLACGDNELKSLNLTGLTNLIIISCFKNNFDACAWDKLFKTLPNLKEKDIKGIIQIAEGEGIPLNDSIKTCNTSLASDKDWKTCTIKSEEITGDGTGCPNSIPENLASELDIKVFPNPVRDALHIESEEIIKQVSVFDISGKLLIKELVNDVNFNLPTTDLYSGIYVLRIQTDKGISNIKVIKE